MESKLLELEAELIRNKWLIQLEREWKLRGQTVGRKDRGINQKEEEMVHLALNKIHPLAAMEFLKHFGDIKHSSATMSHIFKGKAVLYQLIEGCTNA